MGGATGYSILVPSVALESRRGLRWESIILLSALSCLHRGPLFSELDEFDQEEGRESQ